MSQGFTNPSGSVTPTQIQSNQYTRCADTGTTNAYAGTLTPTPGSLQNGMIVSLTNVNSVNTVNNPTFALNGLGAVIIALPNGAGLALGDMNTSTTAILQYSTAASAWILLNPVTALQASYNTLFGYFDVFNDSGSANAYVVNSPQQPGASATNQRFFMVAANENTGASTLTYNGGGSPPIVHLDGSALTGSEIQAGAPALLMAFSGGYYLLNPFGSGGGGGGLSLPEVMAVCSIGV